MISYWCVQETHPWLTRSIFLRGVQNHFEEISCKWFLVYTSCLLLQKNCFMVVEVVWIFWVFCNWLSGFTLKQNQKSVVSVCVSAGMSLYVNQLSMNAVCCMFVCESDMLCLNSLFGRLLPIPQSLFVTHTLLGKNRLKHCCVIISEKPEAQLLHISIIYQCFPVSGYQGD